MRKITFSLLIFLSFLFLFPAKTLASNPPVQGSSRYTTPSGQAPSDGSSTETFTIHLQDSSQNVVSGDVVSISSSNDSTAIFPQNGQTTDGNGEATFTVATTTPGTTKITLFDSTNNVTFTDWFSLTFYDSAKGCQNNPPAPVLKSVLSNANYQATVTWTDSADPVSNYLISYGVESGKYIYGNPNVGSQGTTSYTIGGLAGNKKYYFVVAANNNCGTGGFSNEMSVVAKPIPATPIPTVKPTTMPTTAPTQTTVPVSGSVSVTQPTDSPPSATGTPVVSSNQFDYKLFAIGSLVAGVVMLTGAFVYEKFRKKTPPPQIPFPQY